MHSPYATVTGQTKTRSWTAAFFAPVTSNTPSQRISADDAPTITLNEPLSTTRFSSAS